MKVYNENGDSMTAAKGQVEILLNAGWTRTKPVIKDEAAEKEAAEKEAAEKEAAEKEAAEKEAKVSKPKKLRKVVKK